MKNLFFIFFLFFSLNALADLANGRPEIIITPPSEYTDGSPLESSTDLQGFNFSCVHVDGSVLPPLQIPVSIDPDGKIRWLADSGVFKPGVYGCMADAVDKNGVTSVPITVADFTNGQRRPGVFFIIVQ